MLLIGFTGKAGSGKDTAASMLLEDMTGYRRAFADPLKRAAREIFLLTHDQMNDPVLKEQPIPFWNDLSPRKILQLFGTEGMRHVFGGDVWTKRAALDLQSLISQQRYESIPYELVVYTDCRFDNEAKWVRENGGLVIEIQRPDCFEVGIGGHQSEQGPNPDLINISLVNAGTLDDLRESIREVIDADIRPLLRRSKLVA